MSENQNKPRKFGAPVEEEGTKIYWRIDEWYPQQPAAFRELLKKYRDELLRFNKTLNLIGVKTIGTADAIHFADSLLASEMIHKVIGDVPEIYDFGSGNGFPGLIYAARYPKTKVVLVDSDGRKAEFLKHMASFLGLKNVEVVIKTVEALPDKSVQFAMSRGFASVPRALLSARKCFKKGGIYFHLKGEEWATEVAQIPSQLCTLWGPDLVGHYKLPTGEIQYAIVRTDRLTD